MSTEKRSISADTLLFAQADARAERLRYKKFSQYIQALIEADLHYAGGESEVMHRRPLPDKPSSAEIHETRARAGRFQMNETAHAPTPPSPSPERKIKKYPRKRRSSAADLSQEERQ